MRKRSQAAPPPAREPEKFERWTAQRKAAIIRDVLKGKISVPEAARMLSGSLLDDDGQRP